MKNKSLLIVIIVLAAVIAAAALLYPKLSGTHSPEQQPAQTDGERETVKTADFTVYDMDGNEVALSDFFGKPIVVNFWATWCGPCRSELPAFENAYNRYREDVVFLMVNLTDGGRDTKEGVKAFIEDNGYDFPVYLDIKGYASEAYGVFSIPETLFINADGSLYGTRIGAMSEKVLHGYIEGMIGGANLKRSK